ncbi:MAG: response regulator, partial [Verrucomicrobiota bacterium]
FTESGTVRLKIQVLERRENQTKMRFEVCDEGVGIDPDAISKIFEPFTQSDCSTTRRFGGTGLGLSICKRLVEAMGGEIGVESQQDKGSKFWFEITLPNFKPETSEENLSDSNEQIASNLKALIVEDNFHNRELFSKTLSHLGLDSDHAENGSEGIDMLYSKDYDIIFMDLNMEKLDGLQTTRAIRGLSDEKFRKVPIIAVTANVTPECRRECEEVGMNGFIPKPMTITSLKECLQKHFPMATV